MELSIPDDRLIDHIMELTDCFPSNHLLYSERGSFLLRNVKYSRTRSAWNNNIETSQRSEPVFLPLDVNPYKKMHVGRIIQSIDFNVEEFDTFKLKGWFVRCGAKKEGALAYFVLYFAGQMYLYYPKPNERGQFRSLTTSSNNIQASQKWMIISTEKGDEKIPFIKRDEISTKVVFDHISSCFARPNESTLEQFVRSFRIFRPMEATEESAPFYHIFFTHPVFLYALIRESPNPELPDSLIEPWIAASSSTLIYIIELWIYQHFLTNGSDSFNTKNLLFIKILKRIMEQDPSWTAFSSNGANIDNFPNAFSTIEKGYFIHFIIHVILTEGKRLRDIKFGYEMTYKFFTKLIFNLTIDSSKYDSVSYHRILKNFISFNSKLVTPQIMPVNQVKSMIEFLEQNNEIILNRVLDMEIISTEATEYAKKIEATAAPPSSPTTPKSHKKKHERRVSTSPGSEEIEESNNNAMEDASLYDSTPIHLLNRDDSGSNLSILVQYQDDDDDDRPILEGKAADKYPGSLLIPPPEMPSALDLPDSSTCDVKSVESILIKSEPLTPPHFPAPTENIPTNCDEEKIVTMEKISMYNGTEEPPLRPQEDPSEPTVQE